MDSKIKYRQVISSDITNIISLFKVSFNRKITKEYYNWKYSINDKYFSFVATKDNKIIGHVAFNIKKINFKSKTKYCASRHTSMVMKRFRKKEFTKL